MYMLVTGAHKMCFCSSLKWLLPKTTYNRLSCASFLRVRDVLLIRRRGNIRSTMEAKVNVLAKATTSITQAVQLNVTLVLVAVGLACKSVHFSSLLRLAHPLIYIAS